MDDLSKFTGLVAAVFVTMNRSDTARTCLRKLADQRQPPAAVFVVDNASTDSTPTMIEELQREIPTMDIHYRRLDSNIGNAGGMEIALAEIFRGKFDAVWILDDDSWPEPGALEELLNSSLPMQSVRSCRVIDLATGGLSWPVQVTNGRGDWRTLEKHDLLPGGEVIRIRRSWLGALIPRAVYEKIGPVEGRLFIRGEDEDYPRRVENAGFPVFMMNHSILHHPPAGELLRLNLPGREIVLERGLPPHTLYYRLRNSWWLTKRDTGTIGALALAISHFLLLIKDRGPLRNWLPVWVEALKDAMTGNLGIRKK